MLEVRGLEAGYGETQVIHGVDIAVREGQFHAILGRNGVGKTTTLKTVVGLLPAFGGDVVFQGKPITGHQPYDVARQGIAYVPETRDIFGSLSVMENLQLAARLSSGRDSKWTVERIFEFFPNLANRRDNGGNQLSGGEQQMLAIGRALVMNPTLLVLDEPTEGLAPIVVRQIFDKLKELRSEGMTMLLVEQNFHFATRLSDTASIFGRGQCVWNGTCDALRSDAELHEKWLGV
jgi:branched-chain amino acid transport system ATP-binding protein